MNTNITMEFIEKYPNKSWNWEHISANPNITMEIIKKHPDKPWKWEYISINPNLTIEIIEKYIDKIYLNSLIINNFTYENKRIKKKKTYWLLDTSQVLNRTENLVILSKYM